jgi:hypothetical protein
MQRLRPGFEWSNFGRTACDFVDTWMQNRPLEFSCEETRSFRGWWTLLNDMPARSDASRILLWGELS